MHREKRKKILKTGVSIIFLQILSLLFVNLILEEYYLFWIEAIYGLSIWIVLFWRKHVWSELNGLNFTRALKIFTQKNEM